MNKQQLITITLIVIALLCTSCGDSTKPRDCPRCHCANVVFVEWSEPLYLPGSWTLGYEGTLKNLGTRGAYHVYVLSKGCCDGPTEYGHVDTDLIMPGETATFYGAERGGNPWSTCPLDPPALIEIGWTDKMEMP